MGSPHDLNGHRIARRRRRAQPQGRSPDTPRSPTVASAIEFGALTGHVWRPEPRPSGVHDDVVPLKGLASGVGDVLARVVVLMIGLGAVGARVFVELSRLGIGTLLGADHDSYGPESWQTQPSRRWMDTGASKARLQGAAAHAANPATTVVTFPAFAQDLPLWMLRAADVIVAAGDNLEVMVWAGVMAAALGKPLLQGAVFGEQWLALVRRYPLAQGGAACPACAMGTREWSLVTQRHGCDPHTARRQGMEPTRTLPPVCNLAASLLAGEVLKAILPSPAKPEDSEEIAYCLASHRVWQTKYLRNAQCRCPHDRWREIDIPAGPHETTLEMLLEQLHSTDLDTAVMPSLEVRGELPFASFTFCSRCGVQVAVRRFARVGDVVGRCDCGETLRAVPLGARSVIPHDDLPHCLGIPLSQLGVQPGGAVGIVSDEQSTYFFVGRPLPDIPSFQRP